jgi:hypothetical protein
MPATGFGHAQITRRDGSTTDSWFKYTCGHCGNQVSGVVLAYVGRSQGDAIRWLQCSVCHDASVLTDSGAIYPGIPFGPLLEGLPTEVEAAYNEARRAFSVAAYTAAEMLCRKILMHIAVDKGAKEGLTFAAYIDYLETAGYVTPPMRDWVKLIKDHGNEVNHKLTSPEQSRAEGTLFFTAQLLRSVYEMGFLAKKFAKPTTGAT